jgi:dihydroflavonol-4-reductase
MLGVRRCPAPSQGRFLTMTHPLAKGERFIASAGAPLLMYEIAKILKSRIGVLGKKLPRFQLPNWLVRLIALREPRLKQAILHLDILRKASSEKAQRMLGWTPRSTEEAIVASAESLARLGLLKTV